HLRIGVDGDHLVAGLEQTRAEFTGAGPNVCHQPWATGQEPLDGLGGVGGPRVIVGGYRLPECSPMPHPRHVSDPGAAGSIRSSLWTGAVGEVTRTLEQSRAQVHVAPCRPG